MAKSRQRVAVRVLATAGAAALGLIGLVGAAAADQPDRGTPPGNAPTGSTGTLTVHKHAGPATNQVNNGEPLTDLDRPPLAGAVFTICKVQGIDLTTSAGWTAAQSVTPANAVCEPGTTQVSNATGANGQVVFPQLPIGMYLVKETTVPEGATGSVDFLVTIPYPSKSGTGDDTVTTWLWDVHTYPKNTITPGGSKTVADPGTHGLGSNVEWTIKSRAIGSFGGGSLTEYRLIDRMVTQLKYSGTTSLQYVVPGAAAVNVDSDYYTINPANPADAVAGGDVTVTFNGPGLAWLNGLQAGTYFEWKLTTTVVGVGVLENRAYDNPGDDEHELGKATTDWGPARLLKHEKNNEAKVLKGAKFSVYDVNANDTCVPLGSAAITVNGATQFESDLDGVVNIPGLYVGKNGSPTSKDYCVVETVAPPGYTVDPTPIKITVTPAALAQGFYNAKVPNTPTDGPDLPLTGASGTMLMTVGGLALVALAGGVYLVSRRKAHQD